MFILKSITKGYTNITTRSSYLMSASYSTKSTDEPPLKKLKSNETSISPKDSNNINNNTPAPQAVELSLEAKKKIEQSRTAALTRRFSSQLKDESWKNALKDGMMYVM